MLFRSDPRLVVGAGLGVILSAVYMLWMFQRVYYGKVTHEENETLPDLRPREWSAVLPLCAAALLMGIVPNLFLAPTEASVTRVVQRLQSTATLRVQRPAVSPEAPGGPAIEAERAQTTTSSRSHVQLRF